MSSFDDPRSRQSEELAFRAERVLSKGDVAESDRLFAQAAELEEAVALDVPATDARVLGALAISAVALWFKAGRFDQVQRAAAEFLKRSEIIAPDRQELEEMLASGREEGAIVLFLSLDVGDEGNSDIPSSQTDEPKTLALLRATADVEVENLLDGQEAA
jgi:hypothetical protein